MRHYAQRLERTNKELDSFIYIAAHYLKEPLRGIGAFSKFIRDGHQDMPSQERKGYCDRILINAQRIYRLLDGLLRVSRLSRYSRKLRDVDVAKLIDTVKEQLAYLIAEKRVRIVVKERLPVLTTDYIMMSQVFIQLFSNAIKFNDKEHPVIEVGCVSEGGYYVFSIKDNGPGIARQYHEKVFEMFHRLGRDNDRDGTGAGLTVVKKIVEMHGGNIWIDSQKGEYTTFFFTVPRKPSNAAVDTPADTKHAPGEDGSSEN